MQKKLPFLRKLLFACGARLGLYRRNPRAEEYRDRQVVALLRGLLPRDGWGVDLGGKDGRHGAALRARIVTLDLQPQRQGAGASSLLVRADVRAMPLRTGALRYGFAISVLELVPDGRRFLQEAARIIRPGGSLLLTIPNFRSLHYLLWFAREVVWGGMTVPQRRYRRRDVLDLLGRCGFRYVRGGGFIRFPFSWMEHLPGPLLGAVGRLDERLWPHAQASACSYYYFLAVRGEEAS